jgi:hypothetical protein
VFAAGDKGRREGEAAVAEVDREMQVEGGRLVFEAKLKTGGNAGAPEAEPQRGMLPERETGVEFPPAARQVGIQVQGTVQKARLEAAEILMGVAAEFGGAPGLGPGAGEDELSGFARNGFEEFAHGAAAAEVQDLVREIPGEAGGQFGLAPLAEGGGGEAGVPAPDGAVVVGGIEVVLPVVVVIGVKILVARAQRRDAVGEEQFGDGVLDNPVGLLVVEQGLDHRDGEDHELIGADLFVAAAVGVEAVGEAAGAGVPEALDEVDAQLVREGAPALGGGGVVAQAGEAFADEQGVVPQRLDVVGAVAARGPREVARDAGVHPGVGVGVGEKTLGVDFARAGAVEGEFDLRIGLAGQGEVAGVLQIFVEFADEPGGAVGGVVDDVGGAADAVGDAALGGRGGVGVLPAQEVEDDLAGVLEQAGHEQGAGEGDEGVAAPVVLEPGQAGPDALAKLLGDKEDAGELGPSHGAVIIGVASGDLAAGEQIGNLAGMNGERTFGAELPRLGEGAGGIGVKGQVDDQFASGPAGGEGQDGQSADGGGGGGLHGGGGADAEREPVAGERNKKFPALRLDADGAGAGIEEEIGAEAGRTGRLQTDGAGAAAAQDGQFRPGAGMDVADGMGEEVGAPGGLMRKAAGADARNEIAEEGLAVEPVTGPFGGGLGAAFEVAFDVVAEKERRGYARRQAQGEGFQLGSDGLHARFSVEPSAVTWIGPGFYHAGGVGARRRETRQPRILRLAVARRSGLLAKARCETQSCEEKLMQKSAVMVLLSTLLCGPVWAQGDAYEPDNARSLAKIITNGETQVRSIHAAGDADWVRFQVTGSGARNLRVETAGVAYGDTEVWLYDGSGALVAYDDDSGVGKYSFITRPYLRPRTYFLRIQEYGHDAPIPSYQLQVNWTPVDIAPDAYEPDNGRSTAKTITNGQTQARTIHLPGNADWAKFRVAGDGARNVRIETRGTSGDTQMWLYDANLRQIAYNSNGGSGRFSRIQRNSLPPGQYFIKVQEKAMTSRWRRTR